MSRLLANSLRSTLSKRIVCQNFKSKTNFTISKSLPIIATTPLRSFHQTPIRFNENKESPEVALNEVIKTESKMVEAIPNELDNVYQNFLNQSGFKLNSTNGNANVELIKTDPSTGNKIHVFFDIDEVTDIPTEELTEVEDLENEASALDQILCNVKIFIENESNNTGLFLNLFLQNTESSFMIDFVNVSNNAKQFLQNIEKENEFIDKFNYQGPKFAELDESLQTEFENYLVAKGIDNELADFIVAYSDFKEENEYRTWLTDVSKFLN
ncbi:MAM33 [Candida pseudojiufengensis]|uniref:MAM33 n=1 Tax=Candida pseudojiufengensis TaxID=497109 RepID=UPI002224956D|nr:MAM33 [Candida pseudojiufengensis]KAI5959822.1 MAM33 [Candida pseudojiufengensis]